MGILEDYNEKLKEIMAIPEDKIIVPAIIPVANYIIEADKLYTWCQEDKDALTGIGLDWVLVMDLPKRTNALQHAQANWDQQRFVKQEAAGIWAQRSPEAYNLRRELVMAFRFAFRNNESLISHVNRIAARQTQAEVVTGLHDLFLLGKENSALLTPIKFDLKKLDAAEKLVLELRDVLAAKNVLSGQSPVKLIRDRTFTFLKIAVDEICEFGQYSFYANPVRKAGYTSEYLRRYYSKKRRINSEKAETKQETDEKDNINE